MMIKGPAVLNLELGVLTWRGCFWWSSSSHTPTFLLKCQTVHSVRIDKLLPVPTPTLMKTQRCLFGPVKLWMYHFLQPFFGFQFSCPQDVTQMWWPSWEKRGKIFGLDSKTGVRRRTVRKVPGWELLELSGILTVSETWADHLTAWLTVLRLHQLTNR